VSPGRSHLFGDLEHLQMMATHSFEVCGTMHPLMQHHIPDDQTFEITVSLHHTKLFLLTEFLLAYLTILSESADPVALLVW